MNKTRLILRKTKTLQRGNTLDTDKALVGRSFRKRASTVPQNCLLRTCKGTTQTRTDTFALYRQLCQQYVHNMYTKLLQIYLAKIHQATETDREQSSFPDGLKYATMACLCLWSKLICWKCAGQEWRELERFKQNDCQDILETKLIAYPGCQCCVVGCSETALRRKHMGTLKMWDSVSGKFHYAH